jgi:hypothetical protein
MLNNGWPMVTVDRMDDHFARKLENMGALPRGTRASRVRQLLIDRSGIIQEPVVGQTEFIHRTFQEFLAAKSALDNGDVGALCSKAHDDQWWEVIVLAAGLASRKVREDLIVGLIRRGDKEVRHRHQLHLLAVACLETSVELASALRSDVQKRLTKLVPPQNITEAKAVASAGELAVPFLKHDRKHNRNESAACVRALSIIGGEAGLEMLKTYRHEKRQAVLKELYRATYAFDYDDYVDQVFRHLRPQQLTLERVLRLDALQHLTTLTSLKLWGCWQVRDLTPLKGLSNLVSLSIFGSLNVSDLLPLTHLIQLKSLELGSFPQPRDVAPLANLLNLTSLQLRDFENVSEISQLGSLSQLKSLRLAFFPNVTAFTTREVYTPFGYRC